MATLETGTAANQIPTNGDLGELAFQSKESVNFTGGRAGLHHLDVAAINRQLNINAVDIFVYDTSKDSDGGAWRKRTQNTTWYNETLNTNNRGSRREFPATAVIVSYSSGLTIYDGDDPSLPMWMVFTGQASPSYGMMNGSPGYAVYALNGIIGVAGGYIRFFDFVKDFAWLYDTVAKYSFANKPLVNRNAYDSGGSTPTIGLQGVASNTTYDIAMVVLPGAPVDSSTGLPTPTMAVATSAGVSVIRDNGAVVTIGGSNGTWNISWRVSFLGTEALLFSQDSTPYSRYWHAVKIPGYNTTIGTYGYDPSSYDLAYYQVEINSSNLSIHGRGGSLYDSVLQSGTAFGSSFRGVTIYGQPLYQPGNRLGAYIGTTWNTGYQIGSTKAAWLCSTSPQGSITQTNCVLNSSFSGATGTTPPTGWSNASMGGTYSYSVSSGVLTINNNSGTGYWTGVQINLDANRTYAYSITIGGSANSYFRIGKNGSIGANSNLTDSWIAVSGTGTYTGTFTTDSNGYVAVSLGVQPGYTATFSGLSIWDADSNRSAYGTGTDSLTTNNGLPVTGTILKTPVAAGSDVLGYSNWSVSSSNYLSGNYSLSIGTSDFSIAFWIRVTTDGDQQSVFGCLESAGVYAGPYISMFTSGRMYMGMYQAAGLNPVQSPYSSGTIIADGKWHQICYSKSGTNVKQYVDGILDTSSDNMYASCATFNSVQFGVGYRALNGSLALFRLAQAALSPEQVSKMYNEERLLFQENVKATLYGTSNAITGLAYDEDTGLLHVGTSSGRSVLNGLRRVDNTTVAVSAAISAANGLVVEN